MLITGVPILFLFNKFIVENKLSPIGIFSILQLLSYFVIIFHFDKCVINYAYIVNRKTKYKIKK